MTQMMNDVIQVSVLQAQLFQLLLQRLDLFGCKLMVNERGSRLAVSPGSSGLASYRLLPVS